MRSSTKNQNAKKIDLIVIDAKDASKTKMRTASLADAFLVKKRNIVERFSSMKRKDEYEVKRQVIDLDDVIS